MYLYGSHRAVKSRAVNKPRVRQNAVFMEILEFTLLRRVIDLL